MFSPTIQLTFHDVRVELGGDVPEVLVAYLASVLAPYYSIDRAPTAKPDIRVRFCFDPDAAREVSTRPSRALGRAPLGLLHTVDVRLSSEGAIIATLEDGTLHIAEGADHEILFVAPKATPGVLSTCALRINVAAISLFAERHHLLPVHGAAVVSGDVGVLIGGGKGVGKTSLALALVTGSPSAGFVSNDLVLVGIDNSGLHMYGAPLPLRVGAGTLRSHAALWAALDPARDSVMHLSLADWHEADEHKVSLSVGFVTRHLGVDVVARAPIAEVLWPSIGVGDEVRVAPIETNEARDRLGAALLMYNVAWATWSDLGFNGLPPTPSSMDLLLATLAGARHRRALGARDVRGLAATLISQLW